MSIATRIILVLTLHIIILGSMVSQHVFTLRNGSPINVLTKPVNPDDFYAGNQISFNYTFGEIDLGDIAGSDMFRRFDTAYVVLREIDGIWYARRIENDFPELRDDEVVLRGRVTQVRPISQVGLALRNQGRDDPPFISVEFGIEPYVVSEIVSDYVKRRISEERLVTQILVDRTGRALLLGIVAGDGYPLEEPRLF